MYIRDINRVLQTYVTNLSIAIPRKSLHTKSHATYNHIHADANTRFLITKHMHTYMQTYRQLISGSQTNWHLAPQQHGQACSVCVYVV